MKVETISRLKLIWRHIATLLICGAVFVVLCIGLFFLYFLIFNHGFFYTGNEDWWFFPLAIIVSIAVPILVSWLLYGKRLKDTLIFWGINALIMVITILITGIYNDKRIEIEKRNEIIRVQEESDYSFVYDEVPYYIMLDEMLMYSVSDGELSYGYIYDERGRTETGLEYDAVKKWEGSGRIKGVYVIKYDSQHLYILDSDGKVYCYFDPFIFESYYF